jgi:hypothetical protein
LAKATAKRSAAIIERCEAIAADQSSAIVAFGRLSSQALREQILFAPALKKRQVTIPRLFDAKVPTR